MEGNNVKIRMLHFIWHHPGQSVILRGNWNGRHWVNITMNRSGPFFESYVPIPENADSFCRYEYIVDGVFRVDDNYPTRIGPQGRQINCAYIPHDGPSYCPGSQLGYLSRDELIRLFAERQPGSRVRDPVDGFFHAIMLYNEPGIDKPMRGILCYHIAVASHSFGAFGLWHKEKFLRLAILLWEEAEIESPGCLNPGIQQGLALAKYRLRYDSRPGHELLEVQNRHIISLELQITQLGQQPWPSPMINYLLPRTPTTVDPQAGQPYSPFTPLNLVMPAVPAPPYTLFTPQDLVTNANVGLAGMNGGGGVPNSVGPNMYTDITDEELVELGAQRRGTVTKVPRVVPLELPETTAGSPEAGGVAPHADVVESVAKLNE